MEKMSIDKPSEGEDVITSIQNKILQFSTVLSNTTRLFIGNNLIGDLAKHAVPQPLPEEQDFSGHSWNKRREKIEDLTLLKSFEEQKAYMAKNAKDLAKLFDELEADIKKLPDMERSEENLVKELEQAEKDNKNSLKKLFTIKEMTKRANEAIEELVEEIEMDKDKEIGAYMPNANHS